MLIISAVFIYIEYSLYKVLLELKNASIANKRIFIKKFKSSEYMNIEQIQQNYEKIYKWTEKKYPGISQVKTQDLEYSSMMFKNNKDSDEYKNAIKGKENIKKIYDEIEFDTLKSCYKLALKMEELNPEYNKSDDFYKNNKEMLMTISKDNFFKEKIIKTTKKMILVSAIAIIAAIVNLLLK